MQHRRDHASRRSKFAHSSSSRKAVFTLVKLPLRSCLALVDFLSSSYQPFAKLTLCSRQLFAVLQSAFGGDFSYCSTKFAQTFPARKSSKRRKRSSDSMRRFCLDRSDIVKNFFLLVFLSDTTLVINCTDIPVQQ